MACLHAALETPQPAFLDPALVYLAVAPQWDNLRHDLRFADRLRQMGLRLV